MYNCTGPIHRWRLVFYIYTRVHAGRFQVALDIIGGREMSLGFTAGDIDRYGKFHHCEESNERELKYMH